MVKITKDKDWRVQITKAKKFGRASLLSYLCTNENKTFRTAADGIEKGETSMITQDMKDEAKKFGTTAESLLEQGFIYLENVYGNCHWYCSEPAFGGEMVSLAWYRENQKKWHEERKTFYKKPVEERRRIMGINA